jgi:hypothetical protein
VLNSFQTSGNSPGAARCQVGILGFGLAGSASARRLTGLDSIPSLELTLIRDRRALETRARQSPPVARLVRTDPFDDLLASGVHVVVEAAGCDGRGVDDVRRALLRELALTGDDLIAVVCGRAAIVPAGVLAEPETFGSFPDHYLAEVV